MRALLVEDDAAIAEFVARGLREAGFGVDRAADGEEGLAAARTGLYDVAVVDLMLPRRDGLSVIEAMRGAGISTPVLILSARRPRDADRARLSVRDRGPGIPSHELPRIWDRLFRGDTSRAERGLGLGLSLVKAIVQAHGGTVDVASESGRGSTFTVSLPLG